MEDNYTIKIIFQSFKQKGADLNYYPLTLFEQIFYLFKLIICCGLNKFYYEINSNNINYWECLAEENIILAITDKGSCFNGNYVSHWHEQVVVGVGVFNNWWVEIVEEST